VPEAMANSRNISISNWLQIKTFEVCKGKAGLLLFRYLKGERERL